jgi:RNA polymerase sigma factor (TIGR02999 family)
MRDAYPDPASRRVSSPSDLPFFYASLPAPVLFLLADSGIVILKRAMSDVTQILDDIERGDPHAADRLLPLIYDELRKLAAQKLAAEPAGQTLQATALVHEAYIRLVDAERGQHWNSRGHLFAAAAEAMRRILVEQARHKRTAKAGGDFQRISLSAIEPLLPKQTVDLLELNEALDKLAAKDPRKAELVKLRFFAGLTIEQAADALGISTSTADADWAYSKSWLTVAMSDTSGSNRGNQATSESPGPIG